MDRKQKIYALASIVAIICATIVIVYLIQRKETKEKLPTYFTYSKEQLSFTMHSSNKKMRSRDLRTWDQIIFDLVKKNKLMDIQACRLYAYLCLGQKEVAFLSYNAKGKFIGSLDPISCKIIRLFFPKEYENYSILSYEPDKYSEAIAELVFEKIEKRYQEEAEKMDICTWKPWYISSTALFKAAAPEQDELKIKLKKIADDLKDVAEKENKSIIFWWEKPGTITASGIWLKEASEFMSKQKISLSQRLFVRSLITMAMEDALIAAYDSYWTISPNTIDSSIKIDIPSPNYSSYPSAHAALSFAASKILSFYFFQESNYWEKLASRASFSTVLSGIPFLSDHEAGKEMGEKIGNEIIFRSYEIQSVYTH